MAKVTFDVERCKGCGLCETVCPKQIIALSKEKINAKRALKCPWIYALSILFMLADKAMFIANSNPNSKVITLTVLQQVSVLVTILLGKILYKEKNILYRSFCAILIIAGIIISVI